ncbi:MAG: energy transducer TonB [Candidatus Azobacteroides sp.]|nr:energy transducer TonB [Candidatus Azobacteroides sp.]
MAQFVIDTNGKASYPRIVQSVSPELNREVIRIIREMPLWKPAKTNGKEVPVLFNYRLYSD